MKNFVFQIPGKQYTSNNDNERNKVTFHNVVFIRFVELIRFTFSEFSLITETFVSSEHIENDKVMHTRTHNQINLYICSELVALGRKSSQTLNNKSVCHTAN